MGARFVDRFGVRFGVRLGIMSCNDFNLYSGDDFPGDNPSGDKSSVISAVLPMLTKILLSISPKLIPLLIFPKLTLILVIYLF